LKIFENPFESQYSQTTILLKLFSLSFSMGPISFSFSDEPHELAHGLKWCQS